MENNCCKTIDKSFDIQFLEQTHFTSQKIKHARKMEWVIGIMNVLTHMEMKNYMQHAKCAQLTWKCTNELSEFGRNYVPKKHNTIEFPHPIYNTNLYL